MPDSSDLDLIPVPNDTRAAEPLSKGLKLPDVQRRLGHSRLDTTQICLEVDDETLAANIDARPGIDEEPEPDPVPPGGGDGRDLRTHRRLRRCGLSHWQQVLAASFANTDRNLASAGPKC